MESHPNSDRVVNALNCWCVGQDTHLCRNFRSNPNKSEVNKVIHNLADPSNGFSGLKDTVMQLTNLDAQSLKACLSGVTPKGSTAKKMCDEARDARALVLGAMGDHARELALSRAEQKSPSELMSHAAQTAARVATETTLRHTRSESDMSSSQDPVQTVHVRDRIEAHSTPSEIPKTASEGGGEAISSALQRGDTSHVIRHCERLGVPMTERLISLGLKGASPAQMCPSHGCGIKRQVCLRIVQEATSYEDSSGHRPYTDEIRRVCGDRGFDVEAMETESGASVTMLSIAQLNKLNDLTMEKFCQAIRDKELLPGYTQDQAMTIGDTFSSIL